MHILYIVQIGPEREKRWAQKLFGGAKLKFCIGLGPKKTVSLSAVADRSANYVFCILASKAPVPGEFDTIFYFLS